MILFCNQLSWSKECCLPPPRHHIKGAYFRRLRGHLPRYPRGEDSTAITLTTPAIVHDEQDLMPLLSDSIVLDFKDL